MSMDVNSITNDPTMQSLKMTLDMAAMKHQAVASNIANVNTPGYKRMDLAPSFQVQFQAAMEKLQQGQPVINKPKATITESPEGGLERFDGNNVNMEQELIDLMDNQSKYKLAAKLLAQRYSGIKAAIQGRTGP